MTAPEKASEGRPSRLSQVVTYAQAGVIIVGATMLLLAIGTSFALPVAPAVLLIAAGIAWRALTLSRSPALSRDLARAGVAALLLSALMVIARMIVARGWPPNSNGTVFAFVVSELLLVPVAVVLLALALIWRVVRRGRPEEPAEDEWETARADATALLVLAALLLVGSQITPRALTILSRHFQWGRYGWGPPAKLTDLGILTAQTGMRFPEQAVLLDGEYSAEGFNPFVMAKVRMRKAEVNAFLTQQQPPFSWGQIYRGREAVEETGAMTYEGSMMWMVESTGWRPDLAKHVIFAWGSAGPGRSGELWAVIDLDAPHDAVAYIFWLPI